MEVMDGFTDDDYICILTCLRFLMRVICLYIQTIFTNLYVSLRLYSRDGMYPRNKYGQRVLVTFSCKFCENLFV